MMLFTNKRIKALTEKLSNLPAERKAEIIRQKEEMLKDEVGFSKEKNADAEATYLRHTVEFYYGEK